MLPVGPGCPSMRLEQAANTTAVSRAVRARRQGPKPWWLSLLCRLSHHVLTARCQSLGTADHGLAARRRLDLVAPSIRRPPPFGPPMTSSQNCRSLGKVRSWASFPPPNQIGLSPSPGPECNRVTDHRVFPPGSNRGRRGPHFLGVVGQTRFRLSMRPMPHAPCRRG